MKGLFHTCRYPLREVLPSLDELARYLHLEDTEHPAYLYMQEQLARLSESNLEAVGGYLVAPLQQLDLQRGMLTIDGVEFAVGRQVCGYLKEAEEVALFLCTAGALFSDEAHALNAQGDFMEAYMIDAIGSLAVEKAMDAVQELLAEEQATRGLKITNRYSPGYCNWPLSDQKPLFAMIGENPTQIELSPSCLMHPIKSVSGMIGIGKAVRRREYGCAVCQNKSCIYRRLVQK